MDGALNNRVLVQFKRRFIHDDVLQVVVKFVETFSSTIPATVVVQRESVFSDINETAFQDFQVCKG